MMTMRTRHFLTKKIHPPETILFHLSLTPTPTQRQQQSVARAPQVTKTPGALVFIGDRTMGTGLRGIYFLLRWGSIRIPAEPGGG